ncbi:pentatricopeptide repeat (PPR) superfamily protein [Actinidia rufa]|uniref:Pentatricopeptide repeat (PPR) superfamily protein n=1 Tax=Actinidia rufa TaxID=165716 RepID=A0A7J0F7L0_9ERIC|nr:pentatricopeptide repeat (PPR) superfamily protein [Actinidia rufa]
MAEALEIFTAATAGVNALLTAKPEVWDPLVKKIASSNNVKEIVEALSVSVGVLQCRRKDYENKVEARKTKVPSETYKQWICRVKKIENEVDELVSKSDKQSKNLWLFSPSRSALIKQMQKMGEQVVNLLQESDQLNGKLFADPKLETVVRKNEVPEIRKFETLRKPLEQVLDLLKNNKVNRIGMCGMVGIGKTTIMWNLNNHEEIVEMFDIVIWVKASTEGSKDNLSREHLQQAIVRRLKIEAEGTSNAEEVAERISMVLKGTKYLILLDDVKADIDLNRVGIPDSKNGSKLVMTSRLQHVCSSMADRLIKVTHLSVDESWKMFQDVLQNPRLVNNFKIGRLAWRVCQECNGLPLLIEKVANTFKLKNNECLWRDGLSSWRAWPEKDCQGIKEIYELLKFCYNDLDDDGRKKCFLYGALYPEDSEIYTDYLLECWAAENFLGNDCDAPKDHVRMGHLILSHLKSVSLLEEGMTENHVTMHKIMRQVALYILEIDPECKYLVKTNGALQAPPDADSWSEKNRISLVDNCLNRLPDSPSCNALSTLFLQKNLGLKLIPASFFKNMTNLRVLDLSHTGIMSLPSSLSILISLKVLYLNNCRFLLELPPCIGELVHLEALDLRGSGVNNMPSHIENLTRLRHLRVSFKSENENEEEVIDVIEVAPTTLRICVLDVSILRSYIERSSWRNVQSISSFQFFIGCQDSDHPQIPKFFRYEKYVKYSNGVGSDFPIPEVLDEADAIELVNHQEIMQLSDFGIASMNKVQGCLVESCDAIETIMGTTDNAVLSSLEHLYLKNLPNLESIWRGSVVPGSLSKLKTLVLTSCQTVVMIFPPGAVQQLHEIQYLKIENCQVVEEIIAESEVVGNLLELSKLKKLILVDMPNLRSICGIESLKWPSLEKLKIVGCPSLRKLPFNKDNVKELKGVKAEQHWWEALQWQNQESKERITKLCTLRWHTHLIASLALSPSTPLAYTCSIFQSIQNPSLFAANNLIRCFTKSESPRESVSLYAFMRGSDLRPNKYTYTFLLQACGKALALIEGIQVHVDVLKLGSGKDVYVRNGLSQFYSACCRIDIAEKIGNVEKVFKEMPERDVISWSLMIMGYVQSCDFPLSVPIGTGLIDMFAKCGCIEQARVVFNQMPRRDVCSWNPMICGLATHGLGKEALALFERFITDGLRPVNVTFIGVLNACKMEHYGCMVDLLGRAGLVVEAFELIEKMSVQPDPILWATLLGACKIHGKWEDVVRIRRLMVDRRANKVSGWSLVEAQGRVHQFVAGNREHEKSSEIHNMLEMIGTRIGGAGYVPNVSPVLHDIAEEEKENVIKEHSERLAIAFGISVMGSGDCI